NVNYRYVAAELSHLLRDGDAVAVVFHRRFADAMAAVAPELDDLRLSLVVDDLDPAAEAPTVDPASFGARNYDDAVGEASTERDFGPRSGDDIYLMYTGGTTGMPKGVEWRMEDAFFACIGGGDPMRMQGPVSTPEDLTERILDDAVVTMACAPLIHAAAQWTSMSWWLCGGRVVLLPGSFDGAEVWRRVADEGVNILIL
ncbi:MAG: AMP-binding protein, partial [Halieaceae bacterium]|nr:AMP-binding protein [Halieaceae bacterium]